MKKSFAPSIERLESRIAPASVITLTDLNGDHVTFTSSLGNLAGLITFTAAPDGLHDVFNIDLSGPVFDHTNFSVKVTKAPGADGQAIIGHINGGPNHFGTVTIAADLGNIDAGSDVVPALPAIKTLTVNSLGRFGQFGNGDRLSNLIGDLGTLTIRGDLTAAAVSVTGTLATATIGGSINGGDTAYSGSLYAHELGKITIRHDLCGGDGNNSGSVGSDHSVTSVTIGGSLIGGKGINSGNLYGALQTAGRIGAVTIGHSVIGGPGDFSGLIGGVNNSAGSAPISLGTVTIGHDLIGGTGGDTGGVWAFAGTLDHLLLKGSLYGGGNTFAGFIVANHHIGTIAITGDVHGASGAFSGAIRALEGLDTFTLGGTLSGGSASNSGFLEVGNLLTTLKVGHDIRGGSGTNSGRITTGGITHRTILGSIIPGTGPNSGQVI